MHAIEAQRYLSDRELTIYNAELNRKSRSTAAAYLLWFFVGTLGGHMFYIGQMLWGLLYLLLSVVGWTLFLSGLVTATLGNADVGAEGAGVATLGLLAICLLGLLLLWDLVTLPHQIRKREERIGIGLGVGYPYVRHCYDIHWCFLRLRQLLDHT